MCATSLGWRHLVNGYDDALYKPNRHLPVHTSCCQMDLRIRVAYSFKSVCGLFISVL